MSQQPQRSDLFDEIHALVTARIQGEATPEQSERLKQLLTQHEAARELYVRYIQETVALRRMSAAEVSGRALAPGGAPTRSVSEESTHHAQRDVSTAGNQHTSSTPQLSSDHVLLQPIAVETHTHHTERDGYYDAPREAQAPLRGSFVRTLTHSVREVVWHPIALVFLLGLFAAGIVVYKFSTAPTEQPIAVQPPAATPAEPAARIVSTIDAEWLGALRPDGDVLKPGQRLVLTRGSAEARFNRKAKVIFDAPAEFEVVDGGTCRLSAGKLTAHCPPAARGFAVHTPTGTVTDLGTEFGVYVKNEAAGVRLEEVGEEEQQPGVGSQQDGKQPLITEVHVFRGQVELAQSPAQEVPKSQIPNPKSQILSAGQAATISENKVQPLPAADPFKFALDKLAGQPRKVLLSDDFENYELGQQVQAIGPWIVQSGTRKGQGVSVIDPVERIAQSNAEGFTPLAPPPSLVGRRVAYLGASAPNPPDTFPLLAREIDGRLLAQNCQVLLEFDVFLHGVGFQHSLALATDIGHTAGIELWRDTDAAKKVDVAGMNWYRLRVLLDVANGAPRDVRVDRSHWRGQEGWVRDLSFQPPLAKLDWSTPPKYVIFGYPVVSPSTPAGTLWIDNVRMETISEK